MAKRWKSAINMAAHQNAVDISIDQEGSDIRIAAMVAEDNELLKNSIEAICSNHKVGSRNLRDQPLLS
jgi:hypothetical protein